MAIPEVYSGFGTGSTKGGGNGVIDIAPGNPNGTDNVNQTDILSGPDWFQTLTDKMKADGGKNTVDRRWFCLDLLDKYHKKSQLKRFHSLTFYFRDSTDDSKGAIIRSMLPESFSYTIGGVYTNPISMGGNEFVNAVVQEVSRGLKSVSFSLDTSIVWQSPRRMDIVFKIPVFDDSGSNTKTNYQEAIELFGQAILPDMDETGLYTSTPGPSVFTALRYKATEGKGVKYADTVAKARDNAIKDIESKQENGSAKKSENGEHPLKWFTDTFLNGSSKRWDRISVQVGGLLLLDWCVIKDLKVTFPNTKAQVLHDFRIRRPNSVGDLIVNRSNASYEGEYDYRVHLQPVQAELEVTVSTVMGVTRAIFKDMLYQNESSDAYPEETNKQTAKQETRRGTALQLDGYTGNSFDLTNQPNINPAAQAISDVWTGGSGRSGGLSGLDGLL